MFKVEANVPLPNRATAKYPWAEMKVGDSFFVETSDQAKIVNRLAASGGQWGRRHNGEKFAARAVGGGVRVWRLQ